jgi:hypothetical protein
MRDYIGVYGEGIQTFEMVYPQEGQGRSTMEESDYNFQWS